MAHAVQPVGSTAPPGRVQTRRKVLSFFLFFSYSVSLLVAPMPNKRQGDLRTQVTRPKPRSKPKSQKERYPPANPQALAVVEEDGDERGNLRLLLVQTRPAQIPPEVTVQCNSCRNFHSHHRQARQNILHEDRRSLDQRRWARERFQHGYCSLTGQLSYLSTKETLVE